MQLTRIDDVELPRRQPHSSTLSLDLRGARDGESNLEDAFVLVNRKRLRAEHRDVTCFDLGMAKVIDASHHLVATRGGVGDVLSEGHAL